MESIQPSFARGELSPQLYGRVDVAAYQIGLAEATNAVVHPYGGVSKRPGTGYAARCLSQDFVPRLIPFWFNPSDFYLIEMVDETIRFFRGNQWVRDSSSTIDLVGVTTGVTTVIETDGAHGFVDGDWVMFTNIFEPIELAGVEQNEGKYFIVENLTSTTFKILDLFTLADVDSTSWSAYDIGGRATKDYRLVLPYDQDDLLEIKYSQVGDILNLVHKDYPPYELRRMADDDWTILPNDFSPEIVDGINLSIVVNSGGAVEQRYQITGTTFEGLESIPIVANAEGVNVISAISSAVPPVVTTVGTNTLANGDTIEIRRADGLSINNSRFVVQDRTATTFTLYSTQIEAVDLDGASLTAANVVQTGTRVNATPTITALASTAAIRVGDPVSGTGIPANTIVNAVNSLTSITLGAITGATVNATSSGSNDVTVLSNSASIHKDFYLATGNASPNNTLSWSLAANTRKYSIYRRSNGLYGFIGESTAGTFVDNNIAPTTSVSPPAYRNPFTNPNEFPAAVGAFQQRKVYGGSINHPDTTEFSVVGDFYNFARSFPLQDDDAISATLTSDVPSNIIHYTAMRDLLVFTDTSEWTINGSFQEGLSPTSIRQSRQSSWGSSYLRPLVVDTKVLFTPLDRNSVRDFGFSFEIDGYRGTDLSIFASHLVRESGIKKWTYASSPEGQVLMVREDGVLLCLTLEYDQQVNAWTTWKTDGIYEDVVSFRTPAADRVFLLVRRPFQDTFFYYLEVLINTPVSDIRDFNLLDSGRSYNNFVNIRNVVGDETDITVSCDTPDWSIANGSIVEIDNIRWIDMGEYLHNTQYTVSDYATVSSPDGGFSTFKLKDSEGEYVGIADLPQYIGGGEVRLTYTSIPADALPHLRGQTVSIIADGIVLDPVEVVEGADIDLGGRRARVRLGLPYETLIKPLRIERPQITVQGLQKRLHKVVIRFYRSREVEVGSDANSLMPMRWLDDTIDPDSIEPYTGDMEIVLDSSWDNKGQFLIRQATPLPLTILALVPSWEGEDG